MRANKHGRAVTVHPISKHIIFVFVFRNPTPDDSLGFKWSPACKKDLSYLTISLEPEMKKDTRQKASLEYSLTITN